MEMERQKFFLFNLFSFKLQNSGELRGNVAQTNIEEEEGAEENQSGLAKPLGSSVQSFCMMYCMMFCAMCWWKISSVCLLCMRDLPHTYSCTYLFNQRETNVETKQGL
jgi:hypothetical protein